MGSGADNNAPINRGSGMILSKLNTIINGDTDGNSIQPDKQVALVIIIIAIGNLVHVAIHLKTSIAKMINCQCFQLTSAKLCAMNKIFA